MNPMIQLRKTTPLSLTALVLVCFALAPLTQAVVPAPDGGYAGGNTAEGQSALLSLTTGTYNTAVGLYALVSNTEGAFNTAIGAATLLANAADENTATGAGALLSNTAGFENTATGAFALFSNTEGNLNTATGAAALRDNTGNSNTATGAAALRDNTTGVSNTAIGRSALLINTTGDTNTAIGINALQGNTVGSNNIALGAGAGAFLTIGDENIDIGHFGVADESSTIRIGMDQSRTFIAGISGAPVTGTAVVVDGDGQLGVAPSSKRFKDEIKSMDKASELLFSLKPITFRYKKEIDAEHREQFGLVAEDVEKVNADLVVRDKEGKPYSVRYDAVNAMLLNEFLKERQRLEEQNRKLENHARRIEEQEMTITHLKNEIATLVNSVKEQDSRIQRVCDQIEMKKAVPQVLVSDL